MLSILGQYFIISSISFGLFALFIKPKYCFILQVFSVVCAIGILLYAFISNDFSVQNVFLYSSKTQPLAYKIASLWANHNSSLLFWTGLLSSVSLIGALYSPHIVSTKIFAGIITSIMIIIYYTSNPFGHISGHPTEGIGMNPVLQDMAITIHPPMLYLGYVIYVIPFVYFITILIENTQAEHFLYIAYTASKLSLGFLTSGIALGSWWAYRELGWGGYWFFDPVENLSLIPWLVGIALHHSFMITIKNGKLISTTIALGLTNFLLILLGFLIVRSGILMSVHSFASNIIGGKYIILAFIALVVAVIILYVRRIKNISNNSFCTFQEKSIILGNTITIAAAAILMIGTFYPIIYNLYTGTNTSMNIKYFYVLFLPMAVLIVIFAAIAPHLKSLFVIHFNPKNSAMVISHTGIVILALGIVLNSLFNKDLEFIGKIGDKVTYNNTSVTLRNITYASGPNYYRQIGELWINNDNEITILKPENRLYTVENALSAESDIYSFTSHDLYAVLGNIEANGTLHANIYVRPWMSLIWLGIALAALGIFISAIIKKTPRKPLVKSSQILTY